MHYLVTILATTPQPVMHLPPVYTFCLLMALLILAGAVAAGNNNGPRRGV